MEDRYAQLEKFCEARGIQKYAPEEILELVEDGESADWIVEQVLSEGSEADIQELTELLEQLAPPPQEVQTVAEEALVEPAVEEGRLDWQQLEDLGALPPGVDVKQLEQLLASPKGELLADFGLFCQERGVNVQAGGEGMEEVLHELHEEWLQTPRSRLEGKRPAELMENGGLFQAKVETFRREQPKIGRNDPCPCGSGKKYKKCCGKAA